MFFYAFVFVVVHRFHRDLYTNMGVVVGGWWVGWWVGGGWVGGMYPKINMLIFVVFP